MEKLHFHFKIVFDMQWYSIFASYQKKEKKRKNQIK